jgi:hypothetical protein
MCEKKKNVENNPNFFPEREQNAENMRYAE